MIQRRWLLVCVMVQRHCIFSLFLADTMQTEAATDGMLTIICKDGDTIFPI